MKHIVMYHTLALMSAEDIQLILKDAVVIELETVKYIILKQ